MRNLDVQEWQVVLLFNKHYRKSQSFNFHNQLLSFKRLSKMEYFTFIINIARVFVSMVILSKDVETDLKLD